MKILEHGMVGIGLENLDFNLQKLIGRRSNLDIYSGQGDLLIPDSTVITYDDVTLLKENGIMPNFEINEVDVDLDYHSKVIDETVEQVGNIFGDIRKTKKIPLVALREKVIPMIHNVSDSKHLLHLFLVLQAKDDYTYRHNIAVGAVSNLIGKWMNLNNKDLLQLTTAGLLHDVGKMMIPKEILNKPGRLTTKEFSTMQKHTIYGYEILKDTIGISHRQALVALQHHERMDGSGYPLNLTKSDIDLFSRIVAVADVFHAMSSNRVYKNQSPFYKVLAEMQQDMFSKLDPEITMLFIEKTMNSLIGSTVQLTDGREGTILMVPKNDPTRPLIQVDNKFVNLSTDLAIQIEQIMNGFLYSSR